MDIVVSCPTEKKTTFAKPYRIWVKCNYCDYSFSTENINVINALSESQKYCINCHKDMDLVSIFFCALDKGNILCELCEYSFSVLVKNS
jgi:hypothetical protein